MRGRACDGFQRWLLLFRHRDRLAALGNNERENFGGLGLAGVGGDRVQLAGRLVERVAFRQCGFGSVVELDPIAAFQHVAENDMRRPDKDRQISRFFRASFSETIVIRA
jgi:hypothetical protein